MPVLAEGEHFASFDPCPTCGAGRDDSEVVFQVVAETDLASFDVFLSPESVVEQVSYRCGSCKQELSFGVVEGLFGKHACVSAVGASKQMPEWWGELSEGPAPVPGNWWPKAEPAKVEKAVPPLVGLMEASSKPVWKSFLSDVSSAPPLDLESFKAAWEGWKGPGFAGPPPGGFVLSGHTYPPPKEPGAWGPLEALKPYWGDLAAGKDAGDVEAWEKVTSAVGAALDELGAKVEASIGGEGKPALDELLEAAAKVKAGVEAMAGAPMYAAGELPDWSWTPPWKEPSAEHDASVMVGVNEAEVPEAFGGAKSFMQWVKENPLPVTSSWGSSPPVVLPPSPSPAVWKALHETPWKGSS